MKDIARFDLKVGDKVGFVYGTNITARIFIGYIDSFTASMVCIRAGLKFYHRNPHNIVALAVKKDIKDNWIENSRYPIRDWTFEVMNNDTRLGYWEWVDIQTKLVEEGDANSPTTKRCK